MLVVVYPSSPETPLGRKGRGEPGLFPAPQQGGCSRLCPEVSPSVCFWWSWTPSIAPSSPPALWWLCSDQEGSGTCWWPGAGQDRTVTGQCCGCWGLGAAAQHPWVSSLYPLHR